MYITFWNFVYFLVIICKSTMCYLEVTLSEFRLGYLEPNNNHLMFLVFLYIVYNLECMKFLTLREVQF